VKTLVIDSAFEGSKFSNVIGISRVGDLEALWEQAHRQDGAIITLDARDATVRVFNALLKFIEEWEGDLVMIVKDPVPLTIQSRFTRIIKKFKPNKQDKFIFLRMRNLKPALMEKLKILYGTR